MVLGGEFDSNLVARHLQVCQSACGILALVVATLLLVPSCNMPSAMNTVLDGPIGPVTAEDEVDVEEVPAPPKKKTRGPGKKNSA